MKINKIKINLNHLCLIIFNLIGLVLMVVIYTLTFNRLILIPFILIILLINIVYFYGKYQKLNQEKFDLTNELAKLFSELYLDLNNKIDLKDSLNNLLSKASLKMNEKLSTFVNGIKLKNIEPYLNFSQVFSSSKVETMLIRLYQYEVNLTQNNLLKFNECYISFTNEINNLKSKRNRNLFSLCENTALLGAIILLLTIVISIISIMGDYLNV